VFEVLVGSLSMTQVAKGRTCEAVAGQLPCNELGGRAADAPKKNKTGEKERMKEGMQAAGCRFRVPLEMESRRRENVACL
jgi:hypothetical protein